MKLRKIKLDGIGNCMGGSCPSIYETEDGDFVVQGYLIASNDKGSIGLPPGEDAVLIPRRLLEAFARHQKP